MSIYCRKETGMYYLKIKDGISYKRVSLGTKSRQEAQDLYNAYRTQQIQAKLSNLITGSLPAKPVAKPRAAPTPKRSSLALAHRKYIETCKAQNLTQYSISRKIKTFESLEKAGITAIGAVNQNTVNALLKEWENSSTETRIRHIKNLKAFLNYCINQGLYSIHTYKTLKFPSLQSKVRETTIPETDFQLILKSCEDEDFQLYLQALWETGCRPSEIVNLKKTDIDFNRGIAQAYQSKTKKDKTIYFTNELLEKLRAIKTEALFAGQGKQPAYYGIKFKKLRDRLSLNKSYNLYAIRHTFGTRILNKTKDIHLVSKLLGHSDISITAKHYINRNPEEIRAKLLEAHHG